uniref:Biopterin-dependent aromatic amino acid hydroxylase family profile domain-containing protein n=1 Tax=Xiphophorus couchianus TaxID=32473 RepID=A0A3B5MC59_9TELE
MQPAMMMFSSKYWSRRGMSLDSAMFDQHNHHHQQRHTGGQMVRAWTLPPPLHPSLLSGSVFRWYSSVLSVQNFSLGQDSSPGKRKTLLFVSISCFKLIITEENKWRKSNEKISNKCMINLHPYPTCFYPEPSFGSGQPIPRIKYTSEEVKTWGVVFRELTKLYPTHACSEYLKNLPLLTKHCGYREDNIPQLEDVSRFLRERSGFTVRPVAGYLSPRDFLAGLAYRVFNCTQYIRHSTDPLYTPEPDTCHELLGHVPLLADPKFAQFSQEIGLASLGATDEDVQKLATCYFFTIEFGLCKQDGQLRAYGAGLLSSIGELRHALSDKACVKMFDPKTTCNQECLITTFQDVYFVSESFEEAKEKMREFAKSIKRPFSVYYNPYTQSVDLLKDTRSIENVVQDLRSDLTTVCDALGKMNTYLGI